LIRSNDASGFGARLFEQFHAIPTQASLAKRRKVTRAGLRDGIEERIAAADVGPQRMFHANAVAEMNTMLVTRPPAIEE
jgi:hypothetical protein